MVQGTATSPSEVPRPAAPATELLEDELVDALQDHERVQRRISRLRERIEIARIAEDPDFQARTVDLIERARNATRVEDIGSVVDRNDDAFTRRSRRS